MLVNQDFFTAIARMSCCDPPGIDFISFSVFNSISEIFILFQKWKKNTKILEKPKQTKMLKSKEQAKQVIGLPWINHGNNIISLFKQLLMIWIPQQQCIGNRRSAWVNHHATESRSKEADHDCARGCTNSKHTHIDGACICSWCIITIFWSQSERVEFEFEFELTEQWLTLLLLQQGESRSTARWIFLLCVRSITPHAHCSSFHAVRPLLSFRFLQPNLCAALNTRCVRWERKRR